MDFPDNITSVVLAGTVYIYTVLCCTFGHFPAKKTYIHHKYMVLAKSTLVDRIIPCRRFKRESTLFLLHY